MYDGSPQRNSSAFPEFRLEVRHVTSSHSRPASRCVSRAPRRLAFNSHRVRAYVQHVGPIRIPNDASDRCPPLARPHPTVRPPIVSLAWPHCPCSIRIHSHLSQRRQHVLTLLGYPCSQTTITLAKKKTMWICPSSQGINLVCMRLAKVRSADVFDGRGGPETVNTRICRTRFSLAISKRI